MARAGRQPTVSGDYRGAGAYFGTMVERMGPLDDWRVTLTDVLANEKAHAALVSFHVLGSRRGIDIEMDGFHMVRLDEDGRIAEGWGFTREQETLDRFFSSDAPTPPDA